MLPKEYLSIRGPTKSTTIFVNNFIRSNPFTVNLVALDEIILELFTRYEPKIEFYAGLDIFGLRQHKFIWIHSTIAEYKMDMRKSSSNNNRTSR